MKSASIRQRRLRERQRAGVVVAPVVVNDLVVEVLIESGWLKPEQSEDRRQIGRAIAAMQIEMATEFKSKKL